MAVAKCAFCGKEQEDYKGVYYIKNDGTVLYFSSGKCLKNHLKLKRDKRKVRWTEAFHQTRQKRIDKEIAKKQETKTTKKEVVKARRKSTKRKIGKK